MLSLSVSHLYELAFPPLFSFSPQDFHTFWQRCHSARQGIIITQSSSSHSGRSSLVHTHSPFSVKRDCIDMSSIGIMSSPLATTRPRQPTMVAVTTSPRVPLPKASDKPSRRWVPATHPPVAKVEKTSTDLAGRSQARGKSTVFSSLTFSLLCHHVLPCVHLYPLPIPTVVYSRLLSSILAHCHSSLAPVTVCINVVLQPLTKVYSLPPEALASKLGSRENRLVTSTSTKG